MTEHKLTCFDLDFQTSWLDDIEEFAARGTAVDLDRPSPRERAKKKTKVVDGQRLRRCSICYNFKPESEYYTHRSKMWPGVNLQAHCISCAKDLGRKRNQKPKEHSTLPLGVENEGLGAHQAS